MPREPKTLLEAIRYFSDPDACVALMVGLRWPDGVVRCPTCGSDNVGFHSTRRLWQCKTKHPKQQFSVKVGTIFEDSPLGLDKWLAAIWMIANCKNGISSWELHRALGITQKSAWFVLHRVRLAMQTGSFEKLKGEVEADETFFVILSNPANATVLRATGQGTIRNDDAVNAVPTVTIVSPTTGASFQGPGAVQVAPLCGVLFRFGL